jgi:serine/threonine protein kinase/tetratricopeptide (TPR) repeat protein
VLGHYRIIGAIGAGGMGVVYRAVDERLNRDVALKMIRRGATDDHARARMWREARAAARINHPNVCQIYEIGEADGELFLTMELLEGEPLSATLARGPLACAEAVQLILAILTPLEVLHQRGIVHRDLKPSNVFLTAHGVKLLDFGLARPVATTLGETVTNLTVQGGPIGTPNYMAPEQVLGHATDGRADLFAVGSILFEMLSGKPPFANELVVRVLHAIVADDPPALGGSPAIIAVDRVIRRALSKSPDARYHTAEAMARDLRSVLLLPDSNVGGAARPMTRLIVLPFRVLRPDSDIDFLAFSLPDAITNSLSGLDSLIVRSSAVASRFTNSSLDVTAIGTEVGVDMVLTGTLMRSGDQLRVSTQLVAAADGAVVWSQTAQVALGDLFALQDQLASRIVESLSLPLTDREHRLLKHDVPASAKAYDFYLRGNQALAQYAWVPARELFLQCLDLDPQFAPAWAGVGAAYRSLGKFSTTESDELLQRSENAFMRALELNPDLPRAHNLFARLQIDLGHAHDAMMNLVTRLRVRTTDPDLFAGLVQACRYCGLLDASVAADRQARRVDRRIRTSVVHTYIMMGAYQRALDIMVDDPADTITSAIVLIMLDRKDDAIKTLESATWDLPPAIRKWMESLTLLAQGRRHEALAATREFTSASYRDPETLYYIARQLAFLGDHDAAANLLEQAVHGGFFCSPALATDPWLDGLRSNTRFASLLHAAESRTRTSRTAFLQGGGDELLGPLDR